jgi:phosphomannomutase/phosphoglucomutase
MKTPAHVFREYDIRGRAEPDLSDDLVEAIGRALVTSLGERVRIAVARDCRLSSDRLFSALTRGLRASGARVVDVGVGPTPMLYFAAHHLRTDGAVMITGSHNPPEDNGFKLMRGTATLYGEDIQALRAIIEEDRFAAAAEGSVESASVEDAYVEALKKSIALAPGKKPAVVVDAGNGAAGPLGLRALAALGIEVDPLFCEMDGRFPNHHPDPTVEDNLVALRARVAETGAALGIAWDGDGDRIGVIDDAGRVIWGDKLLIIFARAVLAEHPGAAIIGEVKCSQTLFDDIAARGGRPIISRTGHSLIKKRMKEEKALLAGEMSGHIFFADRYFGFDDAIYAAARLVELVTREGKTPRELLADVPETSATPEIRVACADEIKFQVVDYVLAHYRPTHEVLDVDGARIDFGDGAWGLCRASNTGPVLVLRFEALTEVRRDAIRAEVEGVVNDAVRALVS